MQQTLFNTNPYLSIRASQFATKPLGELRSALPIKELAALLPKPKKVGAKGWFDNEGKIALQFLKHQTKHSDEELRCRINTDWAYQMFCGIQLGENEEIKDENLIYRVRKFVAEHFEMDLFQSKLIEHWKPDMDNTQTGLTDATAYESYIAYPTDVKLLWQCVEWLNATIRLLCHRYRINLPRNKFKDLKKEVLSYSKRRRKIKKQESKIRKRLLYLCDKLIHQFLPIYIKCSIQTITNAIGSNKQSSVFQNSSKQLTIKDLDDVKNYFELIQKVYKQQEFHYDNPEESIPNRIVSLHKPYLRPIVRGKEKKRVEFGAKVNVWQVDGLNFIEHFSFNAFHEGIRLKQGIAFHTKHFGKPSQVGADAIYATNPNRTYCTKLKIATCFRPKGRRTTNKEKRKQEDQMRTELGRARATVMEGSFGNEKNHYGLQKIKARTEKTEITWIFFGIMTANAVKVAKRIKKRRLKEKLKKQRA